MQHDCSVSYDSSPRTDNQTLYMTPLIFPASALYFGEKANTLYQRRHMAPGSEIYPIVILFLERKIITFLHTPFAVIFSCLLFFLENWHSVSVSDELFINLVSPELIALLFVVRIRLTELLQSTLLLMLFLLLSVFFNSFFYCFSVIN